MFLLSPPEVANPLIAGEWPWYIINISIIGLILMILAYSPFLLINKSVK